MPEVGEFRIAGTVDRLGVAGRYHVSLHLRRSGRKIRETMSDAAGNYAFERIPYRTGECSYFVAAFDHSDNPLNAAISDLITPEPMP